MFEILGATGCLFELLPGGHGDDESGSVVGLDGVLLGRGVQVVEASGGAVGREDDVERALFGHEMEGVVLGPVLDRVSGKPCSGALGSEQSGLEGVEGGREAFEILRVS